MAITSINLGKIKFNWKGAWALGVTYVKDDVVRYSGSSYVVVTGHTSATSWATNSSKFELMAEGTTPTTTAGDLIYRDASSDTRLPIGNSGQVLTVEGGAPIWKDNGVNDKIYYVSPDGSDSNSGQSWGTAFATIKYACTQATGPATVRVASGTYYEALPITVPSFVAVVGDNQRTTIVSPDSGYEQATMWKLGDGALLNKMCFIGLTGYIPYAPDDKNITLATIGGVYVAFNSASPIATKSPYIIECTAKSAGGVGALLDGALHASGNRSMVFHGYTVILDNGVGYWIKDNAKSEIVSCFTYFCHMGYAATGGGKIRALNGNNSYGTYGALASGYNLGESTLNGSLYGNQLEYTPTSLTGGSFTAGETITGGTSGATGVIQNVQAGVEKLYYKIATGGPFQVGETISNGAGVSAVIATGGVSGQKGFVLVVTGLSAEPKPGASIEFTTGDTFTYVIQNVSGWINSSSKAVLVLAGEKVAASLDGANVRIRYDYSNIRLTGHDFLSIGTGGVTTTNYPGIPVQDSAQGNEVIELFPARVFYVSTDQDGNFRVGEYFRVDQATGRATLNASAFDLSGLTSLRLGSIGAQLGELVNEFSSDETLSGNSNAAVPTEKAVKQYFTKVSSALVPSADDLYTLGTPSKRWNHLYVGPGTITIGTLTISDNAGTLEVKSGANAAPTLINAISNGTSNVSVAANSNVTITAANTLAATFNGANTILAGELRGPSTFTIDPAVVGDDTGTVVIKGNLQVDGTTTTINSTTLIVDDKNIELASVASPTDITADGAGITVKGSTDKTLNWVDATDAWTSSEDFNLLTGKSYEIAGTVVLSATALGSGVTSSSLTSVGTLTSLSTGAITTTGALALNTSGSVTTNQTTFSLVDTTATTVNAFGAGTTITIGATTGTLNLRNATITAANATALNLNGASPSIVTTSTGTAAVFNTNALTGNLFGAATTVTIGAVTGSTSIRNPRLYVNGASSATSTVNIISGGQAGGIQVIRNTSGNPTNGQSLGSVAFKGVDSANSNSAAEAMIEAQAVENHSGSTAATNLLFYTKATGTGPGSSPTNVMTLGSAGTLTVNAGRSFFNANNELYSIGVRYATGTGVMYMGATNSVGAPSIQFSNSGGSAVTTIDYNGNMVVTGTITANSDATLKTNVETITTALDKVLALRGVMFNRISTGTREMGVIAQEVETVVPELVFTDENGIKSVAYANTVALLIEAIKEQQEQINKLKG